MARLTSSERKSLPKSDFAIPGKRAYPVNDPNHARNALARVSEFGSSAEKAEVRAKVHAKYPGMGKSKLHHESSKSVHERGHHENHGKGEFDHKDFHNGALDHGGRMDHMRGRGKR